MRVGVFYLIEFYIWYYYYKVNWVNKKIFMIWFFFLGIGNMGYIIIVSYFVKCICKFG